MQAELSEQDAQQCPLQSNLDIEIEYLITCSYLEIYNEHIMDLLGDNKETLCIREDIKKGIYVENLHEESARTSSDAVQLLVRGAQSRHTGATLMNFESSR